MFRYSRGREFDYIGQKARDKRRGRRESAKSGIKCG